MPPLLIATGEAIPLRGLEGVPGLPGAPQDEAGLTRPGSAAAPHLRWAAVRSFRQVRSPLTAAWCSGKAPSRVSSVAAWPSWSSHSTSAGCPKRAARCSGETPDASWSYGDAGLR